MGMEGVKHLHENCVLSRETEEVGMAIEEV